MNCVLVVKVRNNDGTMKTLCYMSHNDDGGGDGGGLARVLLTNIVVIN